MKKRRCNIAKGDVQLKFDANTAQFVNDVLKARNAMEQLAETNRKVANSTSKMADAMEGAFKSLVTIPTAAAAGAMAVQLLMQKMDEMSARAEERARRARELTRTLGEAMADTGHAGEYSAAAAQIKKMATGNFSEIELSKAAAGIFNQMPAGTPTNRVMAALDVYKKAKEGTMSDEGAIDVATQSARLSGAGLGDQAFAAHLAHLDDADFKTFNRAGRTPEALNMIIAGKSVQEGKGLEQINTLAGLAESDGKGLTAAELNTRRKLLTAMKAGGGNAYDTILHHPEIAGDQKTQDIIRSVARGAEDLRLHPLPTLDDQARATHQDFNLSLSRFERGTAAMGERRYETTEAGLARARIDLEERTNADLRKAGAFGSTPWTNWIPGLPRGEDAANQMENEPEMYWRYKQLYAQVELNKNKSSGSDDHGMAQHMLEVAQKHLKELQTQTGHLEDISRSRTNPTLDNNSEGQK